MERDIWSVGLGRASEAAKARMKKREKYVKKLEKQSEQTRAKLGLPVLLGGDAVLTRNWKLFLLHQRDFALATLGNWGVHGLERGPHSRINIGLTVGGWPRWV